MRRFKSEKDEALFQAMGPIGGVNENYYTSLSSHDYCRRLWVDNTQSIPMPDKERDDFSQLFITASICNACCYGMAKSGAYQSDICSNAFAASSYDHYLRLISIKLNGLSGYMNDIALQVDGIVNGTVTEPVFFANCISLLRYLNFLSTTVDQADVEIHGFQNTLKIQPLRDQISKIIESVKHVVGLADGVRASVAERRFNPVNVQNLKMYMVGVIQAIPQYVTVYDQLRGRLKECYKNNFEEAPFNEFMQYIRGIVTKFHEIMLIGAEASTYNPAQCAPLIQCLDDFASSMKWMIVNACSLMKYRCHFTKTVDEMHQIQWKLDSTLKQIITNFMAILGTAAQSFQNFANGFLKDALQELLTATAEMNSKVDTLVRAVKADKRYILYTPFTPKCITHPVTVMALPGINKIMGVAHTLLEESVDIDEVKNAIQEFTPIYEKLAENLDSSSKSLKSVRKQKAVIQRKQVLASTVTDFVNIMSYSCANPSIPLLHTRCGLVCIDLCLALCMNETHPKLLRIIDECLSMLSNIAVKFVVEKSSLLSSVIVAVRNLVGVPEAYKSVMRMAIADLEKGLRCACDVMRRNSDTANTNCVHKCLLECRKLTILVRSFQCVLSECQIPANLPLISVVIDNFAFILKQTVASMEKAIQLRAFHSLSIFFLLCDRYMMFLETSAEHYVGEKNLKATFKAQRENNAKCRKQLSLHRIEYRNSSKEMMSMLNNKVPEYDQFLKNVLGLVKSEYYAEQLENYYNVMTQALESVKTSRQIADVSTYSDDEMPRESVFLTVAAIASQASSFGSFILETNRNDVGTIFSYAKIVADLAFHVSIVHDMELVATSIRHCGEVLVEASTSMVLGDESSQAKITNIINALFGQLSKLSPYIKSMMDQSMQMQYIRSDVYVVYEDPPLEDVQGHKNELKRLEDERSEMQKSLQKDMEKVKTEDDKQEVVRKQQELMKIMKQEEEEKKKMQAAIRHNTEVQELKLVQNEIAAQMMKSPPSSTDSDVALEQQNNKQREAEEEQKRVQAELEKKRLEEEEEKKRIEQETKTQVQQEPPVEDVKDPFPLLSAPSIPGLFESDAPINPIFQAIADSSNINPIFQDVSGPSLFKRPSKDNGMDGGSLIFGSPTTNVNPIFGNDGQFSIFAGLKADSGAPLFGGLGGNISLALPEYSEAEAEKTSGEDIDKILRQELADDDDENPLAMFGYGRADDDEDEYYDDDFYDDDLDDMEEEEELPFPFAPPKSGHD